MIALLRLQSVLLALALVVSSAAAQDPDRASMPPETLTAAETLSLAAVLIGDGNAERARSALARIDPEDPELDAARFHTLAGLVALNLEELPLAAREFEAAIDAGQADPLIWLYLAQARFGSEDHAGAIEALHQAGPETTRVPSVFLMRAQAHWNLKQYSAAWRVLGQGRELFPDRAGEFARRQVFLLIDQGLFRQAAERGLAFLETEQATVDDAVAIGNALRESGQYQQAAVILERARLSAPEHVMLGKVLSHVYLSRQQVLAAAEVMRNTALYDSTLIADAAELYRRAGWLVQALTLNAQVIDQPKKLKQRLAIFLEMNRFEQAAGMASDLERVGLLEDEDIRYALAYAHFKAGEFERAETHLAQLTRSDLFRRAVELRRVMERCGDQPWMCG